MTDPIGTAQERELIETVARWGYGCSRKSLDRVWSDTSEETREWWRDSVCKLLQSRIAEGALDKATVDAVLETVGKRSEPTIDPAWSAGWNAAMDFVSKAIVESRDALSLQRRV